MMLTHNIVDFMDGMAYTHPSIFVKLCRTKTISYRKAVRYYQRIN